MRGRIVDEGVQEVSEYIPSKARRNDDNRLVEPSLHQRVD
jgi:hypothetical protein